jgi:hypothetical protein
MAALTSPDSQPVCGMCHPPRLAVLRDTAGDRPPPWWRDPIGELLGCPVIVDPTLPPGRWRLLGGDGKVIHEGTVGP